MSKETNPAGWGGDRHDTVTYPTHLRSVSYLDGELADAASSLAVPTISGDLAVVPETSAVPQISKSSTTVA